MTKGRDWLNRFRPFLERGMEMAKKLKSKVIRKARSANKSTYAVTHSADGKNWVWSASGRGTGAPSVPVPDAVRELISQGKDGVVEINGEKYRVTHD